MSNRRKSILAILLIFTVALGALSIYITTRPQAPTDSSAATDGGCAAGDGPGDTNDCDIVDNESQCIVIHRCTDDLGTVKGCTGSDPDYDGYATVVPSQSDIDTNRKISVSPQEEANAHCKRVQVDIVNRNADGTCNIGQPIPSGESSAATPDPASCPALAVCPANIENLTPVINIPLKNENGEIDRTIFYTGDNVEHQVPFNQVSNIKNTRVFVCRNCSEAEYANPPANKIYAGRVRVIVTKADGTETLNQIYTNMDQSGAVAIAREKFNAGGKIKIQILKDAGSAVCKRNTVIFTESTTGIACNGSCFRNSNEGASPQGNCSDGFTCSNSGANSGKCILNACVGDPSLCNATQCDVLPTDVACTGACVVKSDGTDNCASGLQCSTSGANAGKCITDSCAANPGSCTANQCATITTDVVCAGDCITNADGSDNCASGLQCSAGKCIKDTCATNPSLCEANKCDLKTNLTCGSACFNDGVTNQCGTGNVCAAAVGSAGSCKLATCATNPAACSDTAGCNLLPLPSCGDAICNENELCERTSADGTTYRACLSTDDGGSPTGGSVASCTFTGANACQQPYVPSCNGACGEGGLCPQGHTCNAGNVCVLNTCLTEGNCIDNCTVEPGTPVCGDSCTTNAQCPNDHACVSGQCTLNGCTASTCTNGCTPICGGPCGSNSECPTNHSCNAGKCILNGCTAATCTNGCTVIPTTGILDDARFLLVGMSLVTLGFLTYKYRVGRSLSLGFIDSEALFVEKLERSVDKKMKKRNK